MRKLLAILLAGMMMTAASGCGGASDKKSESAAESEVNTMPIPDNWDGVTFKNKNEQIVIVAPEDGWTSVHYSDDSLMLQKGDDGLACVRTKQDEKEIKSDEDEIKASVSKRNNLIDFKYSKAEDGTITYDYVIESGASSPIDFVKYTHGVINAGRKTELAATTKKGNNERLEELKAALEKTVYEQKQ